jgi:signal transduction histidine kinase
MAQISHQSPGPLARPTDRVVGASGDPGSDPQPAMGTSVRTHTMGRIVVLEVTGRLSDVVQDLDVATQLALALEPRGVVCDLSGVIEVNATGALRMLASAGRHPRDWPGVPVAMAGLDPQAAETLSRKPRAGHLIVSASLRQALSSVLEAASPVVESLHLTTHPTAPRASRDFVSRTLLDWRLSHYIAPAVLVVSELVMNAITHAETDIDVTISAHRRTIRVAVRDRRPDLPVERLGGHKPGRGLTIVAGLSSAWGVLPTAEGGKVVWAVLDAAPDQTR